MYLVGCITILTDAQRGPQRVVKKSAAIHQRKGCHARPSEGCVAERIREHVERAHVPQLVGNRWCEIYTLKWRAL